MYVTQNQLHNKKGRKCVYCILHINVILSILCFTIAQYLIKDSGQESVQNQQLTSITRVLCQDSLETLC